MSMSPSGPWVADCIGWIATAVFVASYFFSKPAMLRGLQMLGAALWMCFGILIASKPVIVSNVLVFAAAAWTLARERVLSRSTPSAANRVWRGADVAGRHLGGVAHGFSGANAGVGCSDRRSSESAGPALPHERTQELSSDHLGAGCRNGEGSA
jgi:hypothetical protein